MKLSFFAKDDLLVTLPGQRLMRRNADTGASGSPMRYVGRQHVPAKLRQDVAAGTTIVDEAASNPATPEAFSCDADTEMGRRLAKLVRRDGSLWPADKATADACGVAFVETVFQDGAHVEKAKTTKAKQSAPSAPAGKSEA
jgi:hypothetical protein